MVGLTYWEEPKPAALDAISALCDEFGGTRGASARFATTLSSRREGMRVSARTPADKGNIAALLKKRRYRYPIKIVEK